MDFWESTGGRPVGSMAVRETFTHTKSKTRGDSLFNTNSILTHADDVKESGTFY